MGAGREGLWGPSLRSGRRRRLGAGHPADDPAATRHGAGGRQAGRTPRRPRHAHPERMRDGTKRQPTSQKQNQRIFTEKRKKRCGNVSRLRLTPLWTENILIASARIGEIPVRPWGGFLGAEDACLPRLRRDAESSGTARQRPCSLLPRGKGKDRKEDKQTCRPPATEASCGGSPARLAEPREPRSPLFSNSRSLARRSRSGHREPARTGASSTRPSSRRDPEGAEAGRGVFR